MAHMVCTTCSRRTLISVLRSGVALMQPKPFELLASLGGSGSRDVNGFLEKPPGNNNPRVLDGSSETY